VVDTVLLLPLQLGRKVEKTRDLLRREIEKLEKAFSF
jgi:hypothetical protein